MKQKWTVYKITLDGEIKYIGSSRFYTCRKWQHLNRQGTRRSAIPADIDLSRVKIEVIGEYYSRKQMLLTEAKYIEEYNTLRPNGWNIRKGKRTKEQLRKYNREYNETRKDKIREYYLRWYEKQKAMKLSNVKNTPNEASNY